MGIHTIHWRELLSSLLFKIIVFLVPECKIPLNQFEFHSFQDHSEWENYVLFYFIKKKKNPKYSIACCESSYTTTITFKSGNILNEWCLIHNICRRTGFRTFSTTSKYLTLVFLHLLGNFQHAWHFHRTFVFSFRRKVEIMHTHSLFTLLGERLMLHTNTVTVTTYNTLYEVQIIKHTDCNLYCKMYGLIIFCIHSVFVHSGVCNILIYKTFEIIFFFILRKDSGSEFILPCCGYFWIFLIKLFIYNITMGGGKDPAI